MESMALVSAIAQSQDAPNIAEPSTVGLLAGAALAWRSCVGTYTAIRGLAMDIDDQWTVNSEGNGKVLQLSDDEEHAGCVLCEYSDDTGGALAHLKQMDTALGGRTADHILGPMMEETYDELFYKPMIARGMEVPELNAAQILKHFSEHDINPLRVLQQDVVRLKSIQDALVPRKRDASGRVEVNASDARQWAHLERMKMDLVRQLEQTDARTSREMPQPPALD